MASSKPPQVEGNVETFDFSDSELVIGLVYAVGTNYKPVRDSIERLLAFQGISGAFQDRRNYPGIDHSPCSPWMKNT